MQIDVEIVQDGKFLGIAKSRPVRRLPTAVAGAVLRAKVYPVYRENDGRYTINLRDEPHHPAECPFWRGSAPNFHPPSSLELPAEWYVETNTFGHYLLFDGSESVVEAVLTRLDARDLTVRRHGRSHRPADNGTRYDWFVRLADEGERGEMLVRLRRALEPEGQAEAEAEAETLEEREAIEGLVAECASSSQSLEPSGTSMLPELIQLRSRLAESETELAKWREQAARERAMRQGEAMRASNAERTLFDVRGQLNAANERSRSLERSAKITVKRLRERLRDLQSTRTDPENSIDHEYLSVELKKADCKIDELLCEVEKLEAERDQTLEMAVREEKQRVLVEQELVNLQGESQTERTPAAIRDPLPNDGLTSAENDEPSPPRRGVHQQLRKYIGAVLKLWPRLRFHDDCIDTIVLRFSDPSTLFKLLSDLNGGADLARKKLCNVEGWFEVDKHIATGRCRRGRLYVRPTNDRCEIFVHYKKDDKEQSRTIRKLGDPAFFGPAPFEAS